MARRPSRTWFESIVDETSPSMGCSRREEAPDQPAPFESHDRLLEAARQMFKARDHLLRKLKKADNVSDEDIINEDKWRKNWHASFEMSKELAICKRCIEAGLHPVEREVVILLLLEKLGLVRNVARTVSDMIERLGLTSAEAMEALRSLDDNGRLVKEKLIFPDNTDIEIGNRSVNIDPLLMDAAIRGSESAPGWPVNSEEELFEHLNKMTSALEEKSSTCRGAMVGIDSVSEFHRWSRRVDYHVRTLDDTLDLHPEWKLSGVRKRLAAERVWLPFLALLGKELGHLGPDHALFTGDGLVRITMNRTSGLKMHTQRFLSAMRSLLDNWIRPCGGQGDFISTNEEQIFETEFEITDQAREALGLEIDDSKRWKGRHSILRSPAVRMEQLILADETVRALELAKVHALRSDRLMKDWGLGEVIHYGKGVTMLFHGPPGVGKTSAAEALAGELERKIMVADYSRLQNCYVGMTEKNIVGIFRQASLYNAVLFWDEADAMMTDRERSVYAWESRQVNVILQEIENYEGVCILATNRLKMLDAALERRITLKVEFPRPDRSMRAAIWRKLIPAEMPVAGDVDVERLSDFDMSGGEIKNAVLNAARNALNRSEDGPVTMEDLMRAALSECEQKWTREGKGRVGFRA